MCHIEYPWWNTTNESHYVITNNLYYSDTCHQHNFARLQCIMKKEYLFERELHDTFMAYRLSMTIKLYWKIYLVDISDIFIDFIGFILKAINFKKMNRIARWYYALQYCITIICKLIIIPKIMELKWCNLFDKSIAIILLIAKNISSPYCPFNTLLYMCYDYWMKNMLIFGFYYDREPVMCEAQDALKRLIKYIDWWLASK